MAAPLVDRSTGDLIPASDHNDVKDYIEDGTYRVNTLSLSLGGTEVISSARQLSNIASLDATTESTIESAIDTLGAITFTGAITCTVDNNDNYIAIALTNNDTTNNPNCFNLVNAGTGNALYIDQNGNGISINIDSESTTANVINIAADVLTTGCGIYLYSNSAQTNTRNLMSIINDNTAASGTYCLSIQNDSTSRSIYVNATNSSIGTSDSVVHITSVGLTQDARVLRVVNNTNVLSGDSALVGFISNTADTNSRGIVQIEGLSGSRTAKVLAVSNAGTGSAIDIDQNGNGNALNIVNDGSKSSIDITHNSGQWYGINLSTFNSNGYGLRIERKTTAGAVPLVEFATHSSDTQPIFSISNAGSGISCTINQNSSGIVLNIDQDSNDASACYGIKLAVDNAGAGLEYAFHFATASLERVVGTGTTTKYIRVMDSGGTEYTIEMKSVA